MQKTPSEMPKGIKMAETERVRGNNGNRSVWQMWHQKGQRCPKGTVPIRRSTAHDVLRAKSLYHFGKKSSRYAAAATLSRRADAPDVVSGYGHEVCVNLIPLALIVSHKIVKSNKYYRVCQLLPEKLMIMSRFYI